MKQALLLLFVFTQIPAFAQPERRRPDTLYFSGSPHQTYLNHLYHVDVLEGRTEPQNITPNREKICFDKMLKVKAITSRGPAEVCLFINTKIGLIAYTPVRPGTTGICDIKPDDPEFRLFLIGLKGNTFHYMNIKKKNTVEHYVQTSNSENYQYQFSNDHPSVQLRKKMETRDYCDGKIKAHLYRVDGKPGKWYLWGKQYPDGVTFQATKFLGNFGVGYAYSDKGLFLIMQMEQEPLNSKIIEAENINICFNTEPFKVIEAEQQQQMQEVVNREQERLQREERKTEKHAACQDKKSKLIQFKKEALERRQQSMNRSQQGNAMQNKQTQQAMVDVYNYDDMIQEMIYDTELKICRAEQNQAEHSSSKNEQKIRCLQQTLVQQKETQQKFNLINEQFRNNPGEQMTQKTRLMTQAVVICN